MPKRAYQSYHNRHGQLTFITWKVWRRDDYGTGFKSFDNQTDAMDYYNQFGARIDKVEITVLAQRD